MIKYTELCCECGLENSLAENDVDKNWMFKCKKCGTVQHLCSMCSMKNCARQNEKGFNCFQLNGGDK